MPNRTMTGILNAFNSLIARYDFQKITVEMIIEEAQISRSTFIGISRINMM